MKFLELMVELPVITLLGCNFVCTFQPFRSRVFFMRLRSDRSVNILRAVFVMTFGIGFARIWWANRDNAPLVLAPLIALPIGLALGCGVVILLRRCCPAFLKSTRVERGMFFAFAGMFLFMSALIGVFAENFRDWIIAAAFAGFAALELVAARYWPIGQTKSPGQPAGG